MLRQELLRQLGMGVHLEKVRGAEVIDDGLDPAGAVQVLPDVEVPDEARGADHGGEMPAGRCAPDRHTVRVETVLPRMGPEPAHRGLAILDLGGEDRVLAQAVVDGRERVALVEVLERQAVALIPVPKSAAVDLD